MYTDWICSFPSPAPRKIEKAGERCDEHWGSSEHPISLPALRSKRPKSSLLQKRGRDLQNTNIRYPADLTCRSDSRLLGMQQKHTTERLPLRVAKRCREQRAPGRRSLRSIPPYRELSSTRAPRYAGCPFYDSPTALTPPRRAGHLSPDSGERKTCIEKSTGSPFSGFRRRG